MRRKAPRRGFAEKVNIRITPAMRVAVGHICQREDLMEMEVLRYLIEAGLMVVAKRGLAGVMAERSAFLAGEYPPPPEKPGPRTSVRRRSRIEDKG